MPTNLFFFGGDIVHKVFLKREKKEKVVEAFEFSDNDFAQILLRVPKILGTSLSACVCLFQFFKKKERGRLM